MYVPVTYPKIGFWLPNPSLDGAINTNNKSFKSRNNDTKTIPKKIISQKQTNSNANTNANNVFEDREDAKLILQLESAIGQSPKFDLEKFKSSLESKVE